MPLGLERRHNTGQLHFITFSCYHRLPLLEHPNPKDILERIIEKARHSHDLVIYAYVLMPEHVHLLTSEPKPALSPPSFESSKANPPNSSKVVAKTSGKPVTTTSTPSQRASS